MLTDCNVITVDCLRGALSNNVISTKSVVFLSSLGSNYNVIHGLWHKSEGYLLLTSWVKNIYCRIQEICVNYAKRRPRLR